MTRGTLIVTRGLPASGKTTWAKQWVAQEPKRRARVNRDDLRSMLWDARAGLTFTQEEALTAAQRAAVAALLAAGLDVVADDTNLRAKYVRQWRDFAREQGVELEFKVFEIDLEEAIRRDCGREHPVGEAHLRQVAERFLRKGQVQDVPEQGGPAVRLYQPVPGTPPAIMVDLDGTLALMDGRSPFDWSRVGEDAPNRPVVEAVAAARAQGVRIVYCSGRDEAARADTEAWLAEHAGRTPDEPLFMRPAGDSRKDSIVKAELFDAHIRDEYDVRFVLDDRNQVVLMWRGLGLTVFQVAPGDF